MINHISSITAPKSHQEFCCHDKCKLSHSAGGSLPFETNLFWMLFQFSNGFFLDYCEDKSSRHQNVNFSIVNSTHKDTHTHTHTHTDDAISTAYKASWRVQIAQVAHYPAQGVGWTWGTTCTRTQSCHRLSHMRQSITDLKKHESMNQKIPKIDAENWLIVTALLSNMFFFNICVLIVVTSSFA